MPAPVLPTGSSAPKSASGKASRISTAKESANSGRAMSAARPMVLNPFTHAKTLTAKKGAYESTDGTFSYNTCITNARCSSMGSSAEKSRNAASAPYTIFVATAPNASLSRSKKVLSVRVESHSTAAITAPCASRFSSAESSRSFFASYASVAGYMMNLVAGIMHAK